MTCYNSCRNYSIETPADYDNEDQAAQALYNDALAFCSDQGGLAYYRVESFYGDENVQLSGTSWEVTRYNDGRGLVDINLYRELDLRFWEDGKFGGRAFCNNYMGDYTVSEDEISMEAVISTYKWCEQRRMRQDDLLVEAFRDAARYETRGDQLILKDDYGRVVLLLSRK
ncbi:META domain-containing protein [Candidatus Electrothrix sp.]|uniref:META domain-containing protein n=1 Tax=Candidatus Electrothrix sp. TaxID=2170559 RepID=UPI0040577489